MSSETALRYLAFKARQKPNRLELQAIGVLLLKLETVLDLPPMDSAEALNVYCELLHLFERLKCSKPRKKNPKIVTPRG